MRCNFQVFTNFVRKMEYNLAIDQGNSSSKLYLFAGLKLVASRKVEHLTASAIDDFVVGKDVRGAIISSVVGDDAEVVRRLAAFPQHIVLTASTPLPIAIDYSTPETLGRDRIAAAVGARDAAGGSAVVVIDAGTAITLDVVDADGHYRGGNISPGVNMRFAALNHYTARLPLLDSDGEIPDWGHDTATAIRSGVIGGVAGEIEGFVKRVANRLGCKPQVWITGGDSAMIAQRLAIDTFQDSYLLAKGLNRILIYNNENS